MKLSLVFLLTVLSLSTLGTQTAHAQTVYDAKFQSVQSIELFEITEQEYGKSRERSILKQNVSTKGPRKGQGKGALSTVAPKPNGTVKLGQIQKFDKVDKVIAQVDSMIALGERIYSIVEKGRPVVNLDSTPVSVLPVNDKGEFVSAFSLENWQTPKTKKYRMAVKNLYGITTVSFEFMLIFTYGGSLDGKGKYITAAQIKPTYVNVLWGYNFDASFKLQSITNQGTSESPVAAVVLMMDYSIKTVMQESSMNETFHVNGLGQVTSF